VDYPAFRADPAVLAAFLPNPDPLPRSFVYRGGRLLRAYYRPISAAEVAAWPTAFGLVEPGPGDAEVLAQRGVRLLETSKVDEALAVLLQATRLDEQNLSARTNLAVAYGAKGDWPQAIAQGKAALVIRPEHLPAELNLAVALSASGAHGEAIAHYRRVVARQPKNRAAQFNLAVAYAATGQAEQAKSLLRAWVKLAPVDREAKAMLDRLEGSGADAKP
jgi:tetratricopeptide (TPR) repeat protein